jgi:hypothetical protein
VTLSGSLLNLQARRAEVDAAVATELMFENLYLKLVLILDEYAAGAISGCLKLLAVFSIQFQCIAVWILSPGGGDS